MREIINTESTFKKFKKIIKSNNLIEKKLKRLFKNINIENNSMYERAKGRK
jgi:hypothetical protein